MTALQIAKSRSTARTETHVAFRGAVANPEWEGMSVTVGEGDGNGGDWGNIGQPQRYTVAGSFGSLALTGGTASVGVDGPKFTNFATWAGGIFIGGSLRVYRAVNGEIELIRTATVTGEATDYFVVPGGTTANIITGNSLEFRLPNESKRDTYTFGVARIVGSEIGPIATVTQAFTDPGYTTLTPATPTTGAARPAISGRNGSIAAVTGLAAEIRADTTHNVILSWDAGAPDAFVVFINWDGTSDRLGTECTLSFDTGPAILAGDMLVFESAPILAMNPEWISRRVRNGNLTGRHGPQTLTFGYNNNVPGGRTWEYIAYDGGNPKPDITYPDYYLRLNGSASLPALAQRAFHSGTDQSFYMQLVPGRTYRARFRVRAASAMNATFAVSNANVAAPATVALTTTWQEFDFDFTRDTILKSGSAQSWSFTGAANNVSIDMALVQVWDTTRPYNGLMNDLPEGIDVRDHLLIKQFPNPSLDMITSRPGFGPSGWCIAALLAICAASDNSRPHFQFEWFNTDQFYYDLTTYLYAPASSGEPLALKREALGFGPVNLQFPRHLWEGGNEDWNGIMWAMFNTATDSVTGEVYTAGTLSGMFNRRRRAIMESNPYFPSADPPIEFAGGWLRNTGYTVAKANAGNADYISVAMYTSGTDVNKVILADNKERWSDILTISEVSIKPDLESIIAALPDPAPKLAVYEAGPGYQLGGLNGAVVTTANEIEQEVMTKSIGGTTALMATVGVSAVLGVSPYNFFTWGDGQYWQAARRPSENAGHGTQLYRVAGFLKQTYEMLGRCRIFATNKFIDREQEQAILDSNGDFLRNDDVSSATIYHFESLDFPGRHGILYVNRRLNLDAFGVGHPDYVEGVTGAAEFRYHTGLPSSATPWKVLRNEGNFRQHDAYKVGFRPNVVGSAIDGYVEDPLCVDLTVTPEDFEVDNVQIRELTLLGGNCRLEVFET